MGYDFLAIRALTARGKISGVGRQIGMGKESDIFEVCPAMTEEPVASCPVMLSDAFKAWLLRGLLLRASFHSYTQAKRNLAALMMASLIHLALFIVMPTGHK